MPPGPGRATERRPGDRPRSAPRLLATVRAVVRHDGNLAVAASELCIHRNTLTYRLDRIQELTGRDPRRLLDAVAFVSEIVREP